MEEAEAGARIMDEEVSGGGWRRGVKKRQVNEQGYTGSSEASRVSGGICLLMERGLGVDRGEP